ncbi:hypothetical protein A1OE_526 [Candidatus Endolissoclinum faulkneri L2]|uniref:Uncharacterized protein n=1 Tax=Candidatus Endolissoclinum faulkneri L2 TaxID=1193729 RepID=K7YQ66_9PROT|nr:hypothetical protein A1OE_526 [Candidatus Endolissoclinum faulkneri L2]
MYWANNKPIANSALNNKANGFIKKKGYSQIRQSSLLYMSFRII